MSSTVTAQRSRGRGADPWPDRAVAIALPPEESVPVAAELREAGFTVIDRRATPTSSRRSSTSTSRRRRRDPRRRDRLRHVARVLRAAPRRRSRHPGPDGRLAADARSTGSPRRRGRRGRVLHPPLLRRVAPLARRGDVHPQPDRRRRQPARSCRAARSRPTAGRAARRSIAVFNPKGGVGKTTIATNLAVGAPDAQGPERPAARRRHRHRPRHDVARHDEVRTVVDSWRDEADGGPVEIPRRSRRRAPLRPPGRLADVVAAAHRGPRPRSRRRHRSSRARRGFDSSSSTCTRPTARSTRRSSSPPTASSCRSRPDVPAIRAAVQLRDVASELGIRERLALVINRANSGVGVADMERTVGMPALALHPVGWPALRPRRERGPDRHRDVPQREDHARTSMPSPTGSWAPPSRPRPEAGVRAVQPREGPRRV